MKKIASAAVATYALHRAVVYVSTYMPDTYKYRDQYVFVVSFIAVTILLWMQKALSWQNICVAGALAEAAYAVRMVLDVVFDLCRITASAGQRTRRR